MVSNDQILEHRKWPETLKIANAWWYLKKQDRDSMKIDYKICFPLIMMGIKATGFGVRPCKLMQIVNFDAHLLKSNIIICFYQFFW
jgi:hypothetical protein